ncbi:MAG: PGPGW domain-containing protein [Verrucomicrobia bacterium]|nr:PGPGW domain-containing protein [Verrucomicrobiota bacterium]
MKRLFIMLVGGTVLLVGIALLVLPGPGLPIMAAGIAILATEFLWARRVWRQAKGTVARARRKFRLKDWLRRRRNLSTQKGGHLNARNR